MTKRRSSIDSIIERFTADLEAAIREEIHTQLVAAIAGSKSAAKSSRGANGIASGAAKSKAKAGRRVRRSAEQLAEIQQRIVALLGAEPKLTSEQIQERLGLGKDDVQRPLQLLRDDGRVKTVGERRAMRHYVGSGKPGVIKRAKKEAAAE